MERAKEGLAEEEEHVVALGSALGLRALVNLKTSRLCSTKKGLYCVKREEINSLLEFLCKSAAAQAWVFPAWKSDDLP